jgi:uncharacterized protein YbjT (DUF2867 family)
VPLNLISGEGLPEALGGVEAVVHSASNAAKAEAVDLNGIRLITNEATPDVHVVYPGIVGSDLIPTAYYRVKNQCEELLIEARRPWTILRATQFHQLIWHWYARETRRPFLAVPAGIRYQPIDPAEVARRLVDAIERGAGGRLPDIGGPTVYEGADLARSCLAATGSRRRLITYNRWGLAAAARRAGANLTPNRAGGETWNEFVARQLPRL